MTPKQKAEAIDACNRILRANANLQFIAAEIKRGCDELRSLWPEANPNRMVKDGDSLEGDLGHSV